MVKATDKRPQRRKQTERNEQRNASEFPSISDHGHCHGRQLLTAQRTSQRGRHLQRNSNVRPSAP
jgi:hypothetical protein